MLRSGELKGGVCWQYGEEGKAVLEVKNEPQDQSFTCSGEVRDPWK